MNGLPGVIETRRRGRRDDTEGFRVSIHRLAPAIVAVFLAACGSRAPIAAETLPAVTLVPAPALQGQQTPSPILPTPDAAATPLPPARSLGLIQRWQLSLGGLIWASDLSDLTAGGYPDILAASDDNTLYALDADGAAYWEFAAAAPLVSVASAELDGEAPREIVVGGDDHRLRALTPGGELRWEIDAGARVDTLAAGDLDGDGQDEVLAGLWNGTVLALDADGAELWRVGTVDGSDPTRLVVTNRPDDVDAVPAILLATAGGAVEALDAGGQRVWAVEVGTYLDQLIVADLDGGGLSEVMVATRDGDLLALESNGELRWSASTGVRLTSLLVADLAGEPELEVLAGGGPAPGRVVMTDAEGRTQWSTEWPAGVRSLAAGDLDEDGFVEIVAGGDDGRIALLDRFGQVRGTYAYATRAPVDALEIATFTRDGALDVLARSGDTLYCFQVAPSGDPGDAPAAGPAILAAAPDDAFHMVGPDEVELVFAGDISLAGGVAQSAAAYGPLYPFEATHALLRRADVTVANLEGVLAAQGEPNAPAGLHRTSPALAEGLQLAGLDVALLANDHALDYGQAALDDTVATLAEYGILTAGTGADREAAQTPTVVEIKGLRIAFLAFADDLPPDWAARPTSPGVAAANTGRIDRAVRQARQQADLVVVGLHMARADGSEPNARQQALAQAAANAGATLVAGYGPGVVQEAVSYRDSFIAYGLGTFVSDSARDGALLRVVLGRDGLRTVDVVPVHVALDGHARLVATSDLPAVERLYPPDVVFRAPRFNADPGLTPDYTLDVALDYGAKRLDVTQAVTARNNGADTWDELVFAVSPNYFEDVFELNGGSVTRYSSQREVEVELEEEETFLRVPTLEPVPPGTFVTVELRYSLFPPPIFATDWQPYSSFGFNDTLIQAGEWYPTLVPYVDGEGWTTWEYYPVGDPMIYQAADYDMTIRADPEVTVASGGEVTGADGGRDGWRFQLENARGVAFLASPTYRCLDREVGSVTIRSCFQPSNDVAGRAVLDMAERALVLFNELFGPYRHGDLVIAENGYYGAMEYSATLSITEPAYTFYRGTPDSLLETLVAHEMAHQWWYDVVGNDQVNEPWLDESLATYSELLYYEHYYPDFIAWWWNYRVLQYEPSGPVDVNIYDHTQTELFVHNMYGQAAFFVQDLRRVMGDTAFFAFLRDYYRSGAGQILTGDDFFDIARRHTDDDLSGLLEGYFRDTDH